MSRKRPRMNITLDPDVKQQIRQTADRLNVTSSRLIEEVMREFFENYREDPTLGMNVKRAVDQRKLEEQAEQAEDDEQDDIDRILHEFDQE